MNKRQWISVFIFCVAGFHGVFVDAGGADQTMPPNSTSLEAVVKGNPQPYAWNTLYRASKERRFSIAERLIAKKTNANIVNDDGLRPLYWAAKEGETKLIGMLLAAGADINSLGTLGTPLHAAADEGHADVVEFLLTHGADVNVHGDSQKTPLHLAAFNGRKDVVELLLAKGADVNAKDQFGNTPLHWAVGSGQLEIIKLLVAKDADINAKDIAGTTPLSSLRKGEYADVQMFLQEHGAK